MATPILLITPLAIPDIAVATDLTAATGGLSYINGDNGSDWMVYNEPTNATPRIFGKAQGRSRIRPVGWVTTGAAPTTGYSNLNRTFTYDLRDRDINAPINTPVLVTQAQGVSYYLADDALNKGIDFVFNADQNLRNFVYMGGLANGLYSITASFADGSMPISTVSVNGTDINNQTPYWFSAKFRSFNPTTVRIRFERLTRVGAGNGAIELNGSYLEKMVPAPKPKGHKRILLANKSFGGFA